MEANGSQWLEAIYDHIILARGHQAAGSSVIPCPVYHVSHVFSSAQSQDSRVRSQYLLNRFQGSQNCCNRAWCCNHLASTRKVPRSGGTQNPSEKLSSFKPISRAAKIIKIRQAAFGQGRVRPPATCVWHRSFTCFRRSFGTLATEANWNSMFKQFFRKKLVLAEIPLHRIREPKSDKMSKSDHFQTCP